MHGSGKYTKIDIGFMKKVVTLVAAVLVASASSFAQENSTGRMEKGVRASVEISTGAVVKDGLYRPDYSVGMAVGYSFSRYLTVYGGLGGINSLNTGTTSLPLFLRVRSEFIRGRVTPFAELEAGYSFIFGHSRKTEEIISTNNEVFLSKLEERGYDDLDKYREDFMSRYDDAEAAESAWAEELNWLKSFRNGARDYIALDDYNIHYGKDGLFASVTLGCSVAVSQHRLDLGLSFGMSQYYEGTVVRTYSNEFRKFGYMAELPDGTSVRAYGRPAFGDRFSPELRLRFAFWF